MQSGGSQITVRSVRSIGHRRREHDDVPIRPVDGPGQSEMVLETEQASELTINGWVPHNGL